MDAVNADIRLVRQSVTFLDGQAEWDAALKRICLCTRIAYRAADPNNEERDENLIRRLVFRKDGDASPRHTSTLEHAQFTVILKCSRAIANEFVRHRHTAFTQESTRYVNFDRKPAEFVVPSTIVGEKSMVDAYSEHCRYAYTAYRNAMLGDLLPQVARDILPLGLATTMAMTTNIAEWRSIFNLRCDATAHPDARSIAFTILMTFNEFAPWAFEDIYDRFKDCGIPLCDLYIPVDG